MSNTPWTPAPWEVDPEPIYKSYIAPDEDSDGGVWATSDFGDSPFLLVSDADAELIALAPEMAAAIEAWARASDVRGTNEQEDEASLLLGEVAMELRQIRESHNE